MQISECQVAARQIRRGDRLPTKSKRAPTDKAPEVGAVAAPAQLSVEVDEVI